MPDLNERMERLEHAVFGNGELGLDEVTRDHERQLYELRKEQVMDKVKCLWSWRKDSLARQRMIEGAIYVAAIGGVVNLLFSIGRFFLKLSPIVVIVLIGLGASACSYPQQNKDAATWSIQVSISDPATSRTATAAFDNFSPFGEDAGRVAAVMTDKVTSATAVGATGKSAVIHLITAGGAVAGGIAGNAVAPGAGTAVGVLGGGYLGNKVEKQ